MTSPDPARQLLRHAIATVAYRGGKAIRETPETFADFRASHDARTPGQILAHIGDLMNWALSIARGDQQWQDSAPLPWPEEVQRFFASLEAFDAFLGSDAPLHAPAEKLLQAPIADALTHIGQIAILRRLAGFPLLAENYYAAKIQIGAVGSRQAAPVQEFS